MVRQNIDLKMILIYIYIIYDRCKIVAGTNNDVNKLMTITA